MPGGHADLEVTVCDRIGLEFRDVAAAGLMMERARASREKIGNFLPPDSVL